MALDEESRKIIHERNFAFIATVNADGSPQVTPVWIDEEDGYLLVNTVVGRVKELNTRRDPRVSIAIADRRNFYRYLYIQGLVTERITGEKAEEHIDKLAVKYTGDKFKWRRPGDQRIILKIRPEKVRVYT
ncbi:MAG: PPOX class F420-dependent oxidoreductase [Candidatus Caldarchaeum sp.]|nr:PPOX class F420-dependent oxidoreductase [Candidatus Caldarchaeum sp.]MDW8435270.1 PPOX class F420-dependent oxidoreductase [Candidatus Caldarchaeum sp.]